MPARGNNYYRHARPASHMMPVPIRGLLASIAFTPLRDACPRASIPVRAPATASVMLCMTQCGLASAGTWQQLLPACASRQPHDACPRLSLFQLPRHIMPVPVFPVMPVPVSPPKKFAHCGNNACPNSGTCWRIVPVPVSVSVSDWATHPRPSHRENPPDCEIPCHRPATGIR